MKKLIKGKWYKAFKSQDFYIKYSHESKGGWAKCSEYIPKSTGIYTNLNGACGKTEHLKEISISEIAHLLPKNHPDLQKNNIYELW